MKRMIVLLAGALAILPVAGFAKDKDKGTLAATRAGWMMGMFVGEDKTHPYPFITAVDPDGEAKKKGIRPGDELIKFDDRETVPLSSVFDRVNELRAGKSVVLWVRRGSETLRFEIRKPKNNAPDPAKADAKKDGDKKDKDKSEKKKAPPVVIKPIPANQ